MSSGETPSIHVRHLKKQHRLGDTTIDALRDVTATIGRGEFVAIVGPSGSGKSTLLHCIAGLEAPTGGSILINGEDITAMEEEERTVFRRRHIGVIFQFFNLLSDLTVLENVAVPLMLENLDSKEIEKRTTTALESVSLEHRGKHRPGELSGGEMQRVAIARAMAIQPAVVLADEPTGNLDSENGEAVLEELRRVSDEQGQTIVMVTHDENAAARADRTIRVRDGRIVDI